MISLEDCIAFSGLDKNEVEAISEHEHIAEIAAIKSVTQGWW